MEWNALFPFLEPEAFLWASGEKNNSMNFKKKLVQLEILNEAMLCCNAIFCSHAWKNTYTSCLSRNL